ncbi:MAG: heme-binding domain-containing protein [Chloroflexota bacterium]
MLQRRRNILLSIGAIVALVIIVQIIPWGSVFPAFAQTNPPVSTQIQWDSPRTERLVRSACYDCHSNETVWPWYAKITPVSWLVAHDTNEGRQNLNFSTQSADQINPNELIEQIQRGDMPKSPYPLMHPDAALSTEQKADLIAGLQASLHGTRGGRRGG